MVSTWVLKDEQVSGTGSRQFNADSDTFPCPHHNQRHFFALVLGFFWGLFYQQRSLLILTPSTSSQGNAWQGARFGPTAAEPHTASKRKGVGLGVMLAPKCGTRCGDTHTASLGQRARTPRTGSTEQHSCSRGNKKSFL